MGVTLFDFRQELLHQKTSILGYCAHHLHDPTF